MKKIPRPARTPSTAITSEITNTTIVGADRFILFPRVARHVHMHCLQATPRTHANDGPAKTVFGFLTPIVSEFCGILVPLFIIKVILRF